VRDHAQPRTVPVPAAAPAPQASPLRNLLSRWNAPSSPQKPQKPQKPQDDTVDIIVPIYGNLPLVQRCVTSALASTAGANVHFTLINDASPQAEVGAWLRQLAVAHPQLTVLENARNLGFVHTVNLGMRLAGRRDVLLLNSDTEVAGDWVERLRRAAWSMPRAASVTPFSNNATICSYPKFCEDNPLVTGQTVASLHAAFGKANHGQAVEIPTAVGFCMYMRRDAIDDIGEFDAEHFGVGYGEENDWCMRALAKGWRHLHALDTFVFHAGGASFSERRVALQKAAGAALLGLHPHYDDLVRAFVQRDPARPYREAVDRLLAANAG